jgi:LmbE family N-acetylglucosaminyl deacetylase
VEEGPGSARRLLGVFAHPDDEVFCAGGTMARAAEAGAEVMIISATRGERGQIRDPAAATRLTLGAVRERELRAAAAELGVQHVQVLAYPDGTLLHHRSALGAAIEAITRRFDPDTIITFGADGGYGHPDHVAISETATKAFRALVRDHNRGQRLYHAVFPPRHTSMAEELAHWIAGSGQRATDPAALHAITLFAGETRAPRRPGDPRAADAGRGDHGLVAGQGTAHVVARDSLTCLVLSRTPIRPYAGRGAGATSAAEPPAAGLPPPACRQRAARWTSPATFPANSRRWRGTAPSTRPFPRCFRNTCCKACSAQSSSAAPEAAAGTPAPAAARRRRVPGGQRAARRRGTSGGIATPALTRLTRSLLMLSYLPPTSRTPQSARSLATECRRRQPASTDDDVETETSGARVAEVAG